MWQLQASNWGVPMMEKVQSPHRRSVTPEQPQPKNRDASSASAAAGESASTASPTAKKHRTGEGDGPLNLSKPKGKQSWTAMYKNGDLN